MLSRLITKSAILCFGVIGFAFPLSAQNKPAKPKADLSGTWLLDAKKSNSVGLTSRPDLPIKISHVDPELRITLKSESNGQLVEREFVYFTDGRGEENDETALLTTNPKASYLLIFSLASSPPLAGAATRSLRGCCCG